MDGPSPGRSASWRHRDALIALALFLALFAWPVREALFDPSRVLCGVDTLTSQLPWRASGPRNAEIADHGAFVYPEQRFVIESWLCGDPPLWNPGLYAGVPSAGNPQVGVLDPQVLLLVALEAIGGRAASDWGLALFAWLRLALAACGAFLLARRLGLGNSGALIAGLSFGGSGFLALWLGTSLARVAWLAPWMLLALERVRDVGRWRAPAAALVFALAIYAGHPETAFFIGLAASAWSLSIWREDRRAGANAFAALLGGVLLAAPVWLPALEYLKHSGALLARSASEPPAIDWLALGLLVILCGIVLRARELWPRGDERGRQRFALVLALTLAGALCAVATLADWPATVRLLLVHDLLGAPGKSEAGWLGQGSYLEQASAWMPTATLALALSGLLARHERPMAHRGFIVLIGVLALLLALRAPGVGELLRRAPLIGLAATVRAAPIAALMLALLAGEAFERASSAARSAGAGVVALVLGLLCVHSLPVASGPSAQGAVDPADEIVGYVELPSETVSAGQFEIEGWIDPGLDPGSLAVRVEPTDPATPVAHELALPCELARAPWTPSSGSDAPAGALWFRAQHLDVRHLAEGEWRFVLELRGYDGALLGERVAAVSRVLRPRSLRWTTLALAFAGLACTLALRPRPSRWGGWPTLLASAALAAQICDFQRGANPAVPERECFPPSATTTILAREIGAGRYLGDAGVMPANSGLAYGLKSLDGYDGLDLAAFNSFRPFALKPAVHPLLGWSASGVDLSSPAFRLLGANLLVRGAPFEHDGWELIAAPHDAPERAETWIYRARDPLPRAFCVNRLVDIESARGDPQAFDARRTAFVEPGTPLHFAQPFTRAEVGEPAFTNNTAVLAAALDGDGLLVLTEQHFQGWHVEVDGARRDLLRVDSIFRGVALAAGEHRIVFRYQPTSLRAGFALALVGAALLIWLACGRRAASA